jgi:hypothetical protein
VKTLNLIPFLLLVLVIFGSVNVYGEDDNLLINSNFNLSNISDIGWKHEYDTVGIPVYYISNNGLNIEYQGRLEIMEKVK